jgi:ferredoxin
VVRVCFESSRLGPASEATADPGTALMDVCDAAAAPVAFSCRDANCGTCLVEVIEGLELLDPPSGVERQLLGVLGFGPSHRLACRARIIADRGLVRVRLPSSA